MISISDLTAYNIRTDLKPDAHLNSVISNCTLELVRGSRSIMDSNVMRDALPQRYDVTVIGHLHTSIRKTIDVMIYCRLKGIC